MLYGGRHWYYAKVMDNLFKQLSEVSTLVFFEDGPLVQQKYDTWIQRQNDKFQKTIRVFDMVHQGVTISRIVENMGKLGKYSIPTVTNHLELIAVTAKKYGTVIVTVTKECDAELARFASNNPAVIAVLADDTDFLIFPGHWRYWSLSQLNKQTLLTKEYSRTAVRQYLNLNDEQMIVLSTIAGNDIIKYDEVRWNHKQFGIRDRKFLGIAQFIRRHIDITNFNGTVLQLANFLLRDTSEGAKRRICESFEQYNIVIFLSIVITANLLKFLFRILTRLMILIRFYSFTAETKALILYIRFFRKGKRPSHWFIGISDDQIFRICLELL